MEIKPYLRRPQFYETDGMSIIWHGNYVRWMEEARTDFMDQLGFPYSRAVEAGIDFALTDISCKYRAMTRFGEELAITVFIRRLSPAKLELGYEMREASTGELKAEGTSGHFFYDRAKGRPVALKRPCRRSTGCWRPSPPLTERGMNYGTTAGQNHHGIHQVGRPAQV